MAALDPFTPAAQAIAVALQNWPGFSSIVRAGNLVDMTAPQFERLRSQVQAGDLPEVAIVQGDFTIVAFGGNSRESHMSQTYWLMTTLDTLNSAKLNAVKYQTYVALLRSGTDLGTSGLVRQWDITSGKGRPDGKSEWSRGATRWYSALAIRVEMYLDRALIVGQSQSS